MARLALTLTIATVALTSLIDGFPNKLDNRVASRRQILQKKGWWFFSRTSKPTTRPPIETGVEKEFSIYTCPLDKFNARCNKRGLRLPYAPYGITHTFIEIGSTCYDWGVWNFPRQRNCNVDEFSCCYEEATRNYHSNSKCTNRVGEFESAWKAEGSRYNIFTWNCQRYTDAMKDFLNNCYADASAAIP